MKYCFLILILIFSLFLVGCQQQVSNVPKASLPSEIETKETAEKVMASKKVLMVIAPKDFRDEEYLEPRQILEKTGVEIKIASLKIGEAIGALGAKVYVDTMVKDVKVEDFDAVLFVGGPGMAELTANNEFIELAKKFYNAGKITSAICIAPVILAKAGILQDKKATVWSGGKGELKKGGANYTGKEVEVDGKIITANGPAAASQFGQAVAEALQWNK